ncbi:hypothetical protein [Williamsia sp. CHRR-6]|uniref:hypothetical protein n=1 Tax=Williamsia sp. CHRR-6 TaxID=2835871 RepID=UPI001BDADB73|nr:hypothetical protein [Williamsia sp. CHRR-6]MBT0568486.1 hypothetical protein [Williamsia sp. CHRR-6]
MVADDWARATAHSAPDLSLASLVLSAMRSLARRADDCAALIEAIATGVRRCRAQLAILEGDWVEIDTQLQSLVLLAQSVVQREMHHRRVRDEVDRTYNAAVDQWEHQITRAAAQ